MPSWREALERFPPLAFRFVECLFLSQHMPSKGALSSGIGKLHNVNWLFLSEAFVLQNRQHLIGRSDQS